MKDQTISINKKGRRWRLTTLTAERILAKSGSLPSKEVVTSVSGRIIWTAVMRTGDQRGQEADINRVEYSVFLSVIIWTHAINT